jgi:hypothetical protein
VPPALAGYSVWGAAGVLDDALRPGVTAALAAPGLEGTWAVSFVDDGVVLDGLGDLPEGEALLPWLDLGARLVRVFSPDAG